MRAKIAIILLAAACASCSVTKHLPEGRYILKHNNIEVDKGAPKKERISAGTLDRYIAQSPNRHFLGTNLYAGLYASADPDKNNGWNRFLRGLGEEPVVWSPEATRRSEEYIETYIYSRGFFQGQIDTRVDTVRGKKVKVNYLIHQGRPWRIGQISYTFRDTLLRTQVLADSAATLLRSGNIFDINELDAERARIATTLKDRGYWDFNVGHVTYVADSTAGDHLVNLELIVRRQLVGYGEDGSPEYENHRIYTLGKIRVRPDYNPMNEGIMRLDTLHERGLEIVYEGGHPNVRPRVLQRAIRLHSDSLYSARAVSRTSAELMRLGAFRNINVLLNPRDNDLLDCEIRLSPGLRQSFGVDLEGSTTSSFYGLRATLGYQNRNAFRGAEQFDASLTAGFEFLKSSTRKLSYELGGSVSLTFPRFVSWEVDRYNRARNPLSTLTLSANWQDRVYYSRALFGLSWGYSWGVRRFENFTLRPADINLVRMGHLDPIFKQQLNNPYLVASYDDQLIAGLSASYVFNNQPRNLEAGAVVFRANIETTGNLLSGLAHLLGKPTETGHYNIFGIQFSQYLRGDVSFSQKIVLGDRTALAYRLQGGAIYSYGNSSSPPFDKLFFAGGVNSMRGWAVRTLGPGTVAYARQNYPAQMGDVKLEANLEFRFPVFRSVNGALFFDTGNIWFMRSKPMEYPDEAVFRLRNFYRQLGFDGGVGVRVDLRVVVLRLDWGIQLHDPGRPAGERWIRHFRWGNTALNFGVGYPF